MKKGFGVLGRMSWVALMTTISLFLAGFALAQESSRWDVTPNVNDLDDFNVQPNSPALAKSLNDAAEYVLRFRLPSSLEEWQRRRLEVREALAKALGLATLPERTPLNVRILSRHDLGNYTLENLVFESRPSYVVTANLYRPKNVEGKVAAILSPIGHILEMGKAAEEVQARCIKLAQMGFLVLTYDAMGHGERMTAGNIHHEAHYALLPLGENSAGWMVWDSMRALDYLTGLPEVDSSRVGITGNSGGGLNALYTAALDNRVAVAAVAGYTFQFNTWMKYGGAHGSCSQLPGLYRAMEWFEIGGLLAPRPLLMLQGERDADFPVSAARKAGHSTEALYALLGYPSLARLDIVPLQPHAYSRPYRERMYGWMALHLLSQGDGSPIPEGEIELLSGSDPRLLCDPDGTLMASSPSTVELARRAAGKAIRRIRPVAAERDREPIRNWVRDLTAAPFEESHNLMALSLAVEDLVWATMEKVYFVSEIGQHVPGLLWRPKNRSRSLGTILVADSAGKSRVAESDLVRPLVEAGYSVLAVDLRGRGETLGRMGTQRSNNYHFVQHSIMWGRPVAGRRAFDLIRALDFIGRRGDELNEDNIILLGIGDDSLPAILAAGVDRRVTGLVCTDYFSSVLSQIVAAQLDSRSLLLREWNTSAMRWGRLQAESYDVDLGAVIPDVLQIADVPELVSLVAPRRVLFGKARDYGNGDEPQTRDRFREVLADMEGAGGDWLTYQPGQELTANDLLRWLSGQPPARDSRNAAISWPLRTSKTSPTSTGWFQVLPSIAGNRASSVNRSGAAATNASSPFSDTTSNTSWSGNRTSWPWP